MRGHHRATYPLAAIAFLLSVPLLAQEKPLDEIGQRAGPPSFGGLPAGFTCREPALAIIDNATVTDSIVITNNTQPIVGLEVVLQVSHTWVGDLKANLVHVVGDVGLSRTIMDRPGFPSIAFGCNGDDIDAVITDQGAIPIETACVMNVVPTISGSVQPTPDPLSGFNLAPSQGTWLLQISDHASGDAGTLDAWCINLASGPPGPGTGGTTGGTGGQQTPATSPWGVAVLLVLFLGVSAHYVLRHRADTR